MKAPRQQGGQNGQDVHSVTDTIMQLMLIRGNDSAPPDLEDRFHDGNNNADAAASTHSAKAADPSLQDSDDPQDAGSSGLFRFEYGVHYALIESRLYFSFHPDNMYTMSRIQADKSLFYFSSSVPGSNCTTCIQVPPC